MSLITKTTDGETHALSKVNVPIPKKCKLGPKAVGCVNLGYAKKSVGYRFLVAKYEVPDVKVGTILESKDAKFFETIFPMRDMQSISRLKSDETPEPAIPMEYYEQTHDNNPEEDDEKTLGRGKRQRIAKSLVMISLCTSWMILPLHG